MLKERKSNFLTHFLKKYDHPAIVLWRSIEARNLSATLDKISFDTPTLDLGCGEGKVSSIIFDQIIDIGLDIDANQVKKAKLTKAYQHLVTADGRFLPFTDESLGLVFSNCVIEHIPNLENVLKEVSRVLRRSGYFVFTVPSENFANYLFFPVLLIKLRLKRIAQYYSIQRNKRLNHFNVFSQEIWKRKLRDLNLEVATMEEYLSKSTIEVWDLLAFLGFLWRKVLPSRLRSYVQRALKSNEIQARIYSKILRKYYYEQCESGGALLIVAQI